MKLFITMFFVAPTLFFAANAMQFESEAYDGGRGGEFYIADGGCCEQDTPKPVKQTAKPTPAPNQFQKVKDAPKKEVKPPYIIEPKQKPAYPTNTTTLLSSPPPPQKDPSKKIYYLVTSQNFCENCLNMISTQKNQPPLKLFLGRLVINLEPLAITFEPIKENLQDSDINTKEYLLSHQYYDNLGQIDLFYTNELKRVREQLEKIDLQTKEDFLITLKKLEPMFNFACSEQAEIYWEKQWVIDREALFWSGISNQKGGNISHLSGQLGSCSLDGVAPNESEPAACEEWRRSIREYPPLQYCSILGNKIY